MLFAIVFLWQPPHVWAIALYRKAEYAAAGFPMLPARVGNRATRRWMLAFATALVPVTLLPWFGGALGPGYATIAAAGGACFVASIVAAQRADCDRADRRVFLVSLGHLAALFLAMLGELILSR